MNDIKIFNNPDFGEIRTVVIDNEPWFVGRDVCKALKTEYRSVVHELKKIILLIDLCTPIIYNELCEDVKER